MRFGVVKSYDHNKGMHGMHKMEFTDRSTMWVEIDEDPFSKYRQHMGFLQKPASKAKDNLPAITEASSKEGQKIDPVAGETYLRKRESSLHAIPGADFGFNECDLMERFLEIIYEQVVGRRREGEVQKVTCIIFN